MAASSSSSYDVFLSFRGEDTRKSFVDHLYAALVQVGISVFKDDEMLDRGQTILEEHVKAIKESRFAVVIFSNNYAFSSFCLEELSTIMECQNQMSHQKKVLPVFYHVDPSDVRNQNRDFAAAFDTHEHKFKKDMDKVNKWRDALTAAANLPGQHILLPDYGNITEVALIRNIVEEILADLQLRGGIRGNHLIGIEPHQIDALYSSVVPTWKEGWTYDVFLSFSARDTGYNFSDHLYAALVHEPIRVFRHDYAGQTISEYVVNAINESRFAVVVFSKNYSTSSLCLEELSTIMECQNQMGGQKKVLPVFYHVDPSDIYVQEQWWIQKYITRVCKCMPWCERAYATVQEGEEDALTAATKLPGLLHIPPNNTGESAFINKIVQQTLADVEISDRRIGKLFFSDKEIGKGSNGTTVLEGMYETRPVAVKRIVKAHYVVALKEIQNLIDSDKDPNIVQYYGVEYDRDFVYIAMEHCICSLHELILPPTNPAVQLQQLTSEFKSFKLPNGYPSPELLKVMRDTVAGLAHLHKLGFIHRDLKPQNVLICKYSSISAKVSDMGISKRLPADKSSLTSATGYGSSGWQAPETLRKERQTIAVDLFSLGCLLFFCITGGGHPFGDDINHDRDTNIKKDLKDLSLVDNIPEAFDLVSKLIHPKPELRPNAAEVYHHPLFWDPDTRLSFFRDASDRVELENRVPGFVLLKALEGIRTVAFGSKWDDKLDSTLLNDLKTGHRIKYEFDKVCDLLRVIRNKFNHYRELPKDVQAVLGEVPTGFEGYFSSQFPKLLMEVYKVLKQYCGEEESLKKYYKKTLD